MRRPSWRGCCSSDRGRSCRRAHEGGFSGGRSAHLEADDARPPRSRPSLPAHLRHGSQAGLRRRELHSLGPRRGGGRSRPHLLALSSCPSQPSPGRPAATCPALELYEKRATGDEIARRNVDSFHGPGEGRVHGDFHLHRLQHDERAARLHLVPGATRTRTTVPGIGATTDDCRGRAPRGGGRVVDVGRWRRRRRGRLSRHGRASSGPGRAGWARAGGGRRGTRSSLGGAHAGCARASGETGGSSSRRRRPSPRALRRAGRAPARASRHAR